MERTEQTTTIDALDASLGELMKAAARVTGESLSKGEGVNIENTGTVGSDGKQGGGQGSMSDAGKFEDIMVGKLTAQGFNAAQISQIVGFAKDAAGGSFFSHTRPSPVGKARGGKPQMPPFVGKADGEEPDGDEGDEDEEEEQEAPPAFGKSFGAQFREDSDIGDVVDVSPFLEQLTMRTTDALDKLQGRMQKSAKRTDSQFAMLAKALVETAQLAKSQSAVINELGKRLGMIERQPAPQRGATNLTGAQAMQKSALGNEQPLKKSEVASVLTFMNLEKSIKEIGGVKTSNLASEAEQGSISEAVLSEVHSFLRRNPGDATAAKNYA